MSAKRDWSTMVMLILIGSILALLFSALAEGQRAPAMPISEELALARTAVREAGMRAYERDDTAAIHSVISFRAENLYRSDYLDAIARYTHAAPVRVSGTRPWIAQLEPSGTRPALFPGHLRWRDRHDRWWRSTLAHARGVVEGEIEDVCDLQPHDWGDENDAIRYAARNPDAIRLDCGNTCGPRHCNVFFHLPRLERRYGVD